MKRAENAAHDEPELDNRGTRTTKVRVLEEPAASQPERRTFLQLLAAQGLSIPAAYFLSAGGAYAQMPGASAQEAAPGSGSGRSRIIRDFADPYVEMIRLLREASEIEHALMVQYLYAAFSVKPEYAAIAGYGVPGSNDLIGVAIQEMQHLREVNELLVALGGTPNLMREDFPFEPEVYPFQFNLEPLSQKSLAKYVYTEAAVGALERKAASASERGFLDMLDRSLGVDARPNHVGSLYDALIHTLGEYIAVSEGQSAALKPWLAKLEDIKRQGEVDHFQFFKRLFTGTHEGFKGRADVWRLPPGDPDYPAYALPVNPSAFIGHPNQIKDPTALSLAWLGNLHYWAILLLSDFAYSERSAEYAGLAKTQMMGPFLSIARHLPKLGAGIPFEPLCTGYAPCLTGSYRLKFIMAMVREADQVARGLKDRLPGDYPLGLGEYTIGALGEKRAKYAVATL